MICSTNYPKFTLSNVEETRLMSSLVGGVFLRLTTDNVARIKADFFQRPGCAQKGVGCRFKYGKPNFCWQI